MVFAAIMRKISGTFAFVLGRRPNERVLSCIAAGPLEDLIAYDGKYFIDRIELLVLHDPAFKHLIGRP
ncbi:hypothetical protein DOO79_06275 [Xanthomonas citri pv. punicae]|nr:hypothetical protein DOO79_06275 [Xanthomonas citri pv. punicae]